MNLSLMPKTWFIDFDGTLVYQKSHLSEKDYVIPKTHEFFSKISRDDFIVITTARECEEHYERIVSFLESHNIKNYKILCGLPSGKRILINDKKPDGALTAYSYNLERDIGIKLEEVSNHI